jgi:hypothetical protein
VTSVLDGFRILEVAEHTFGPAASAILSDWGAEVIKVEPAGRGDAMRGLARTGVINLGSGGVHPLLEQPGQEEHRPGPDDGRGPGDPLPPRGVSDVFLTNKLPRVRKDLRIDVDDIRARSPQIV